MAVNHNTHKLFHWLLIAILAVAPLRGVMAMGTDCDMSAGSPSMADHTMHAMHMTDDASPANESHDCCNDSTTACISDCGAGINFPFIMQDAITSASIDHSRLVARVHSNLLVRAPTPPIRPPAYLQS